MVDVTSDYVTKHMTPAEKKERIRRMRARKNGLRMRRKMTPEQLAEEEERIEKEIAEFLARRDAA